MRLKRDLAGPVRGTGLGLYISKQLVEAMGGSIWVESSGVSGQGSRFYFTLPELNRQDEPLPQKQEDDAAEEADGFLVRGAFALPRSQRTSRAI